MFQSPQTIDAGNPENLQGQAYAQDVSRPISQVIVPNASPARPTDYQMLEDRIKAIEGFSAFDMDARDLCLGFQMWCSLKNSRGSLDLYMSLERAKIRPWRDLSEAFRKKYKYNLDMALTRLHLQNQSQESSETFKEYAQRWREMAYRGLYFEKMIGSSSSNFAYIATIGERIENGVKSGKNTGTVSQSAVNKKPQGIFKKKKEGEYQQPPFQYQPQNHNQQPAPTQPAQTQQNAYDNRGQGQGQNYRNNYGKRPQIDKILVPYAQLVPYLIHVGDLVPKEIPQAIPPYHPKHYPNASCAYHTGYIGHSTKDCWSLKNKIQELMNQKILSFSEEKPNVKTNALPNHNGSAVNAVIDEDTAKSVRRVINVKTPMSVVVKKLKEHRFLNGIHNNSVVCESDSDYCDILKGCVQNLMNQGLVQFSRSRVVEEIDVIEPITIIYKKKKIEAPPKRIQPIHIRVPGGMTRNGRVFSPKYTSRVSQSPIVVPHKEKVIHIPPLQAEAFVPATLIVTIVPAVTKVIPDKNAKSEISKGKWLINEDEQVEGHKKGIFVEEGQEFLKLIKKSDFKIIDRIGQTPSKISIFSLLLSSKAHRKALLKVLNVAHVMQDIIVDQFDNMVANITAIRLKFMIDDKLVIVYGEEALLVSELSLFRYIETEEWVAETPLHCLEFEDKGPLAGWGQVVNVIQKHNRFGIGYRPSARKASPRKQKFNPIKFSSAGFQDDHTVAVVGESSGNK
ncbi:uncharacterized protein LOC127102458 [Lathyrus oleraceus]|uniref:uncharacterized protein LOC127102458 n=1 Tax=Pisum sativum TaxID=3888 RepID=UPI0021D2E0E5|nr:uncharacterized protein LOC127102458 [Pisum sativum]